VIGRASALIALLMATLSAVASAASSLAAEQARSSIGQACAEQEHRGKKVLLVVPDATRMCHALAVFSFVTHEGGRLGEVVVEPSICERTLNVESAPRAPCG
jgi:hypothetical protein